MRHEIVVSYLFFMTIILFPVFTDGNERDLPSKVVVPRPNSGNQEIEKAAVLALVAGPNEAGTVENNSKGTKKEDYLSRWADIDRQLKRITHARAHAMVVSEFWQDTIAILEARRATILSGTAYEGTEHRVTDLARGSGLLGPHHFLPWRSLAFYSFKNDLARDILFDFATAPPDGGYLQLDDWAVYYVTLFSNSGKLLPKAKNLLKEEITKELQVNPDRAKRVLNGEEEIVAPYSISYSLVPFPDKVPGPYYLYQLARLVRALEFNEQIPVDERERFIIVRREMALSWAVNPRYRTAKHGESVEGTVMPATLRKREEHFEIYFQEYRLPGIASEFLWEDAGDPSPTTLDNPYWQKRKAFFEHELAHPRLNYTALQMEYIKEKIREIGNMPTQ